ncbi:chromosome segregation protein SMC [bacterium]|nr:chromosome segregation protein SMC [bacterium]
MKLKSVALKGFKTFPRKTKIELKSGINIIIGPNGSGKSNVVDAVKWTLGEKSPKSLRGGQMEDVIFKGNDKMNPSGFAEVELKFDNLDRKLRMDLDEITVSRKFSRDKSSKFTINDRRAKMKEIVALFADTGITSNSYAIIEQGKIENFLLASTKERRLIFEEAAGVMGEKIEKIETERKLHRTEENLQRIADIIAEKDKQYGGLKRAVSKYERYMDYRNKLAEIKKLFSGLKYLVFEDDIKQYDDKRSPLSLKKAELLKTISLKEEERAKREQEIKSAWNSQSAEVNKKLSISNQIAGLENKRQLMIQDITNKEDLISEDKRRIVSNEDNKKKHAEQLKEWKSDTKEKSAEGKKLETGLEMIIDKLKGLEKDLAHLEKENADLEDTYMNFSGKLSEVENEKISLSSAKASKENSIEHLKVRLGNFEKRITDFNDDLEAARADLKRIEDKMDEFDSTLEDLEKENLRTENEMADVKDLFGKSSVECDSLNEKIKILSSNLENYSAFPGGVRHVMKKSAQKDDTSISGIHDAVANLISYSKAHAHALEVAFGAVLHYVIVDQEDDAKRAIKYLNRIKGGRVTFLPLDSQPSHGAPFKLPSMIGGVVGWAVDLYSAIPAYKDIIDRFIRNVIVVKDMDIATRLKGELRGKSFRIVTLNGELFHSDGRVVGGKRSHEGGLLTLKEEINELKQKHKAKEKQVVKLEEEYQKKFSRANTIREEIEEIKQKKKKISFDLSRYKEETISIEQAIKNFQENKTTEEETIEIYEKEIQDYVEQLTEIEDSLETVRGENTEIREKYEKYHSSKTALENDLLENERIKDRNQSDIRLLESELGNLDNNISNYETLLFEIDRDLKFYKGEIKESQESIKHKRIEIKDLLVEIGKNAEELEGYESQLSSLNEEVKDKEDAKEELSREIINSRSELDGIDKELASFEEGKTDLIVQAKTEYSHLEEYFDDRADISGFLNELDGASHDITAIEGEVDLLSGKIERLGAINFEAQEEYSKFQEEYELLKTNFDDVSQSKDRLMEMIEKVNIDICEKFAASLENINVYFDKTFKELFNGGNAKVVMVTPNDPLETGVDIQVHIPGKNVQTLSLTSGGEKALITAALIFAIFLQNPTPFCIFDEVDSAMDEVNLVKFFSMIKKFSEDIQFIVITHNKRSMEFADVLYGVTSEEEGVSKIMSVAFE